MPDFKIIGNPKPEIGKETQYSVSYLNLNSFSVQNHQRKIRLKNK